MYHKVKKSSSSVETNPDPIQEKMLRRNQIIRKRYADKAKELNQKAKSFANKDANAEEKYQKAANILDDCKNNAC